MISPDKIDVLLHQGADYLNAPGVDAASIGARIAQELSSLTEVSALEDLLKISYSHKAKHLLTSIKDELDAIYRVSKMSIKFLTLVAS
jgi:hypothetical protein